MPGPAPKPNDQRRRRNAPRANTVKLPAAGRAGCAPPFPLHKPSVDELKIWRELWATPQAVQWEKVGWVRGVARYCRALCYAESPTAPPNILAEVRQMEDRFGLTPMAMLRLQWEVVTVEAPANRDADVVSLSDYGDLYGTG